MHFAHAGHHHLEENINSSIDPLLVIALAGVVTVLFVAGLMLTLNHLSKRKMPTKTRK